MPYARNARTHSDEQVAQIAASIREWGWTVPVLIDEDGGLIAGHGRVLAARKLGLAEIPVMVATGWSEAQKRAYVLADNKLALNAGWDADLLRVELADLQAFDFDLGLTGFSDEELAGLLAQSSEGLTDPDTVPDVPLVPVSVPGDVWVMGDHRLCCGDSTVQTDVDKLMQGERALGGGVLVVRESHLAEVEPRPEKRLAITLLAHRRGQGHCSPDPCLARVASRQTCQERR